MRRRNFWGRAPLIDRLSSLRIEGVAIRTFLSCSASLLGLLLLASCSGSPEVLELETVTLSAETGTAPGTSQAPAAETTETEAASTETVTDQVDSPAESSPGAIEYGNYELVWAEEGSVEADVERAFWRSEALMNEAMVSQDGSRLEGGFAGEALARQSAEIERIREWGGRVIDVGTSEYELGFVVLLDDGRAQIQVCLLDTNVWYESEGQVSPDSGTPYEVSYLSMLSKSPEGEWFVVGGSTVFDRPLVEGARPSCFSDS